MNKRKTGAVYEEKAAAYLKEKGYRILEKNYRCPLGEIDLIAEESGYLVFIEVKYRRTSRLGTGEEAVNTKKQRRILGAARWYLNGHCFVSIMLCIPVWKNDRMKYIPLFLYSFRWNIETSYYEQKTFWSLCRYMVRSCKGIEMLVNLINICYCAMKILPYQDEQFSEYRTKSVQEFRFELSQGIRSQIFLTNFVRNIETHIKSNVIIKALKQLIRQQVY